MNKPIVSVIMPLWNVEKYIKKSLSSVFNQTVSKQIEFIIIDDASSDNTNKLTIDIIRNYPHLKPNIIFLTNKENKGAAASRNIGLKKSSGEYIICVDSDDWCEPNYIERLYNQAKESNADIVGCDLIKELPKEKVIVRCPILHPPESNISELLYDNLKSWLHIKLIKRELFVDFDIKFISGLDMWEDLLICIKLFNQSKIVSYLPEALYHYNCKNDQSLTFSLDEYKKKQIVNVVKKVEDFLFENEILSRHNASYIKRKIMAKMWILTKGVTVTKEDISLYKTDHLWKFKFVPIKIRFFLLLCDFNCYGIIRFLLKFSS